MFVDGFQNLIDATSSVCRYFDYTNKPALSIWFFYAQNMLSLLFFRYVFTIVSYLIGVFIFATIVGKSSLRAAALFTP